MLLGKNSFQLFILCTLVTTFMILSGPAVWAAPPTVEWTYHKTPDSLHPDGNEQQMVWLMNRARSNPGAEGLWLASSQAADVAGSRDYFDVDIELLQQEFNQYAVKPPAAFDVRLYYAAEAHSQDLIERNTQDHTGQFEAVYANGFSYTNIRGNVFFYAESALNAHAAFNIDWSSSSTGMTSGRGHRMAVMSADGEYTNVGLAAVEKPNSGWFDGQFAVTGNYCRASTRTQNHYNRFLVGTIWTDRNANERYDPGEGLADITIMPDDGTYYAISADSGGYAIPIEAAGTYTITFSAAALPEDITRTVSVADQSVLLDLPVTGDIEPPATPDPDPPVDNPPEVTTGAALDITTHSALLTGELLVHGQTTTYYFEYGLSPGFGTTSSHQTQSTDGAINLSISGLALDTTYYYRLVAVNGNGTGYGELFNFRTAAATDQGAPPSDLDSPESESESKDSQDSSGCFIDAVQ